MGSNATDQSSAVFDTLVSELDYPMVVVSVASGADRAGCLVGFSTHCSIDPARYAVCISKRNHAKVCVIDDLLLVVGSDNLNRRSWTHDSEISCSVIDEQLDERAPRDPGALGDGARRLARDARLRLWREHLQRPDHDDADLVDPGAGFATLARSAAELDEWHDNGKQGPRPSGHLRPHRPEVVRRWARWPALALYRVVLDPDGRPRRLRNARSM